MSRLSRGHVPSVPSSVPSVPRTFCPLNVNFRINRPKRPKCSWDVPDLSPGRSRGIPTTKFLYVTFLYRLFLLHTWRLRIANREIPKSQVRDRQHFRCEKNRSESNCREVETRKIDSAYQSESHPINVNQKSREGCAQPPRV